MYNGFSKYIYQRDGTFLFQLANYYLSKEDNNTSTGHCHHTLEISYAKSGMGKYYIDDKVYDVRHGDIFILNNIEFHKLDIETSGFENLVIHFEPNFIWSQDGNLFDYNFLKIFFSRNEGFVNRIEHNSKYSKDIQRLFLEMTEESEKKLPGYELMLKAKLLTMLAYIIRHYGYPTGTGDIEINLRQNILNMRKVLEYIDTNISGDIYIDKLAQLLHVSPVYFSALFKKYNGIPPKEYILRKKIARAIEYIKSSNKNISEIMELCGFNNSANFYKAFKKVTGRLPSFYKTNL